MRDQSPYPYRRSRFPYFILGATVTIILLCLLVIFVYNLPPVHSRLAWRVENLWSQINPHQEEIFVPQEQAKSQATLQAMKPTPTSTIVTPSPVPTKIAPTNVPLPTTASTPLPSLTPTFTPTSIPTATPLPPAMTLTGVRYEDQHNRYNYCAPANLAMALSFWGWQGNRDIVGPVLKPDSKDKNVMPYEMADYVLEHTDLDVVVRLGGDLDLIKRFIVAGFPVLVEKGTYLQDLQGVISWMGHYEVITGYDESKRILIGQDSYVGPDTAVPYDEMIKDWRSFNYTYLIIYPPAKEASVMELLGPDADETYNAQHAAQKAAEENQTLSGIDKFFAMYNRGSSLVQLQDYAGAAAIYDEAFMFYPAIPEKDRPWRILWYQTGPYKAYYYTGRYSDVIRRADITLGEMKSEKNLEESYYWRGMAKAALGDTAGAIKDFKESLKWHPGWEVAIEQLKVLGVEP